MKYQDSTNLISISNVSAIISFNVDLSSNAVRAVIRGKIEIAIVNVSNPSYYLGGSMWNITCMDSNDYLSSVSISGQVPQYSPARSSAVVSLSNYTI